MEVNAQNDSMGTVFHILGDAISKNSEKLVTGLAFALVGGAIVVTFRNAPTRANGTTGNKEYCQNGGFKTPSKKPENKKPFLLEIPPQVNFPIFF